MTHPYRLAAQQLLDAYRAGTWRTFDGEHLVIEVELDADGALVACRLGRPGAGHPDLVIGESVLDNFEQLVACVGLAVRITRSFSGELGEALREPSTFACHAIELCVRSI